MGDLPDVTAKLAEYATVPIAFTVATQLVVCPVENGLGGLLLVEEAVSAPYTKDYDAVHGEGPLRWYEAFDMSRWAIVSAYSANDPQKPIGGAVIAWNTEGVDMLEGRSDLAVLWDLRVAPEYRGRGVGREVFQAAEAWARSKNCRELKVETQNVNVPACRFYAKQGCVLRTIRHNAYPDLPGEVQLLWVKTL